MASSLYPCGSKVTEDEINKDIFLGDQCGCPTLTHYFKDDNGIITNTSIKIPMQSSFTELRKILDDLEHKIEHIKKK